MPFDSNDVHSLPAGYLAVTGETVLASQHNPPLEDISAALSSVLRRNGTAAMTAPLKLADGTVSAPALTFGTATSWGLYKSATGVGLSVSGANVFDVTPAGLTLPNSLTIGKTTTFKDGGDVASAAALTLGDGNIFNITGTTAITSIGTKGIGTVVLLRFAGILTLTHHSTDLVLAASANITTAVGDWAIFEEYAVGDWRLVSYQRLAGTALRASLPRGYIDGCILSHGNDTTNDLNFSAGACRDSTDTADIICAAMTGKQLDANWAPGSAAGMRNSAAGITNATYHIYAVSKANGTQDYYAHTSTSLATVITALQAETGGADYIYARMIGSIIRIGGAIKTFKQRGDWIWWDDPSIIYNSATPGTSRVTTAATVPLGIAVLTLFGVDAAATGGVYITSPDTVDTAPSYSNGLALVGHNTSGTVGGQVLAYTNTLAQIVHRSSVDSALVISTQAFQHPRGRDS